MEESATFKSLKKLGEKVIERAQKVSLPFFDGVPLYDVTLFFWRSIVDGAITTRASAIAFSFFIALFPGMIFIFTLIPYIPIDNFQNELFLIIQQLVPESTFQTIEATLADILKQPRGNLLSFGFFAALIFSTNGLASMMSAFDATVHSIYRRTWLSQRLTAIYMLIILSVLLTTAISLMTGGQFVIKYLDNIDVIRDDFLVYLLIIKKWHGREHVIYHTRELNYVIVSRPLFTIIDYLISFPYLFVFYFLSIVLILLIGNQAIRTRKLILDLKFKIQAAIISIVFVSLLGVALATIFYNVGQYQSKHKEDLNEKMKSISEEIDMRLEDKVEITDSLEIWLHRELAKLSNIFRTDINIYGANGNLIASSRGEVFDNGLISTRMNARAYNEIYQNFQADYFESEDIGKLSYLSAYKPIINNYSDYLGFINLPYFIKQDNYSQEITTFVVAFINLYVLLFLASIIAAVFIANQITKPLVVIQENLQKIELGKHNDPIHYNRNDEIGSLVKEYNKKVDELAVSTDLLARSERESAWREMAKQIAHEIKNPLTPMKLNIQHLQRAKGKDKEYLERVTGTLIEQIDNLSEHHNAVYFSHHDNSRSSPVARHLNERR